MTKAFGSVVAVDDVDVGVARGEFFSLLGPSGCGKTTMLRIIAGFDQPTRGRVLLEGRDVSRVPPHRRSVNTVFQQYALFPHMSVFDNVAYGPRCRKAPEAKVREAVHEMLDVVRLGGLAGRKPAQLSGGQQQRVALARALVNLPSALLLDEPLGALDLKLRQAMQIELKRIQREVGITFVFVTHDQEEALTMSDRIAVMNEGRIEQIGAPEAIYAAPASVFVAGFIGMANLLPGRVAATALDAVTVELADGSRLPVAADGTRFDAGAPATVMVRPERLRLSLDEPHGPRIGATVTDLIFQGPVVRAGLAMADGTALVAHLADGHGEEVPRLRPGDRVWVRWAADAAFVLAEESAVAGATGTDVDQVEASL